MDKELAKSLLTARQRGYGTDAEVEALAEFIAQRHGLRADVATLNALSLFIAGRRDWINTEFLTPNRDVWISEMQEVVDD
jgi:hypothetical protein